MNICIVGGGNLGHYIIAKLGNQHNVTLYTRDNAIWNNSITAYDIDGSSFSGKLSVVSNEPSQVLPESQLIFITWPTHVLAKRIHEIEPYIKPGTLLCVCPGYGGKEFICKKLIENDCVFFGTQRVLSSTQIIEAGKSVRCIDNRPSIHIASINANYLSLCRNIMQDLFHKKVIGYDNYLNVTLTPSNPILHTSRLFTLFYKYHLGTLYDEHFHFYSTWDDSSSEILLQCNEELMHMCDMLSLNGVLSLKNHYEIGKVVEGENDIQKMTHKIRSLKFLKDFAPMLEYNGKFFPNLNARYFQEDFTYGLQVIYHMITSFGMDAPCMRTILQWHKSLMSKANLYESNSFLPNKRELQTTYHI